MFSGLRQELFSYRHLHEMELRGEEAGGGGKGKGVWRYIFSILAGTRVELFVAFNAQLGDFQTKLWLMHV